MVDYEIVNDGLENVAKKLTDRKSWIKISPFIESDKSIAKCADKQLRDCLDWNPEEHCPICKGKGKEKTSKSVENHKQHHQLDTKPHQAKETVQNNNPVSSPSIDFFELQSSLQRSSLESLLTYPTVPYYDPMSQAYLSQLMLQWSKLGSYLPPPIAPLLLPFAPPTLQLQQTSSANNTHATVCADSSANCLYQNASAGSTLANNADEPLDLSVKTQANKNAHNSTKPSSKLATAQNGTTHCQQQSLGSAQTTPVVNGGAAATVTCSAPTSKKAYSQADLEAAVQDIRCGKLGTRRASVVYGIPRSTLRNKIYKLEASEDGVNGASARKRKKVTAAPCGNNSDLHNIPNCATSTASKRAVVTKVVGPVSTVALTTGQQHQTSPAGSLTTSEESSETNGSSSAVQVCSQSAVTEKLVQELAKFKATSIAQCCWNLTGANDDADSTSEICRSALVNSLVSEAAHSALHEQLLIAQNAKTKNNNLLLTVADVANVGGGASSSRSRKRGNKGNSSAAANGRTKSADSRPPHCKRPPSANSNNGNVSSDCSQGANAIGADGSRKMRPKRGQYRRYDKNALAEAVQSVRRGEMSVHRAGSYYGVPHSTLEYKVKERNLLRPKKRDQTRQNRAAAAAAAAAVAAAASTTTDATAARRDSMASAGSLLEDSPGFDGREVLTSTRTEDDADEDVHDGRDNDHGGGGNSADEENNVFAIAADSTTESASKEREQTTLNATAVPISI